MVQGGGWGGAAENHPDVRRVFTSSIVLWSCHRLQVVSGGVQPFAGGGSRRV